MTDPIQKTLYRVAEDILEKLAFMFSFPEEDGEEIDYDDSVLTSVSFNGPFNGSLIMAVSNQILPELAGNMLGMDEETNPEQQQDALKELINVICGNLLPAIAGKKSVFNVSAPMIIDKDKFREYGTEPVSVAKMAIEDEPCELFLFTDEQIPTDHIAAESE